MAGVRIILVLKVENPETLAAGEGVAVTDDDILGGDQFQKVSQHILYGFSNFLVEVIPE